MRKVLKSGQWGQEGEGRAELSKGVELPGIGEKSLFESVVHEFVSFYPIRVRIRVRFRI